MNKNNTLMMTLALLLVALLPLGFSACGGKYNQQEKAYMEGEIEYLSDLLLDIDYHNPIFRERVFGSYFDKNTQNAPELLEQIDEGLAECGEVIAYLDRKRETPEEVATEEDLEALRDCVRRATYDMRDLLELFRDDIEQSTYSLDAAYRISNHFINTYRFCFDEEAYRLAREYGLRINLPI